MGATGARKIRFQRFREETAQLQLRVGERTLNALKALGPNISSNATRQAWNKEMSCIMRLLRRVEDTERQAMQQASTREKNLRLPRPLPPNEIETGPYPGPQIR